MMAKLPDFLISRSKFLPRKTRKETLPHAENERQRCRVDRHDPRWEPGFSRRPSSSIFVASFVANFVVSERSLRLPGLDGFQRVFPGDGLGSFPSD